jgi:hypothetical protein
MDTSLTLPQQRDVLNPNPKSNSKQSQPKPRKAQSPPLIIVDDIKNYNAFHDKIGAILSTDKYSAKLLNGNIIKLNVFDGDTYRTVTDMQIGKYIWHSYENKQARSIRVMVKNLHHSCSPDKIVNDLRAKDYRTVDAVC